MKPILTYAGIVISCLFILTSCKDTISVKSLLQEMSDRRELTYFPEPQYKLKQSSSYNRETVAVGEKGWYANADMSYFIRVEETEGRREFVLLDNDGPGAIVRWFCMSLEEG